ncbi:MAG: response regulator FixJ [Rhodospirillaceae bacterium]|nr:response regulator FixJ [Rhodospirillaceae bacterium]
MSLLEIVFVVDDDEAVRDSLAALLEANGLQARTYPSAVAFLAALSPEFHGCVVADIRMPGMDGLELQNELVRRAASLPMIIVTGHADVTLAVRAMKAGAVDFVEKPYDDDTLVDSIHRALETARRRERQGAFAKTARLRIETLTPREREVMELLVDGAANKVVAHKLGISERTVEVHRARVMTKMHAKNVSDLVRAALIAVNASDTGNP